MKANEVREGDTIYIKTDAGEKEVNVVQVLTSRDNALVTGANGETYRIDGREKPGDWTKKRRK